MARAEITGRKHHLDGRASQIVNAGDGDDDDLLTARQLAIWLGVSETWLESGRASNYGPSFVRLSPKMVRYRRSDVIAWLKTRTQRAKAGRTR